MTNRGKAAENTVKLALHFGDNSAAAERVLGMIEREPARLWRAEELLGHSGIDSMMELLMIVSRLTYVEMIAHPDLGVYAALDEAASGQTLRSA